MSICSHPPPPHLNHLLLPFSGSTPSPLQSAPPLSPLPLVCDTLFPVSPVFCCTKWELLASLTSLIPFLNHPSLLDIGFHVLTSLLGLPTPSSPWSRGRPDSRSRCAPTALSAPQHLLIQTAFSQFHTQPEPGTLPPSAAVFCNSSDSAHRTHVPTSPGFLVKKPLSEDLRFVCVDC